VLSIHTYLGKYSQDISEGIKFVICEVYRDAPDTVLPFRGYQSPCHMNRWLNVTRGCWERSIPPT